MLTNLDFLSSTPDFSSISSVAISAEKLLHIDIDSCVFNCRRANLDADQIYFVNQIIEYIVRNGVMKDMTVLQEPPFTDRGSIVQVFTDLTVWLGIKAVIDRINANAAA